MTEQDKNTLNLLKKTPQYYLRIPISMMLLKR